MPPPKVAKNLARIMGVLFLLLGLLAFLPNPVIGAIGYFRTDTALNCVLLLFAALLLSSTTKGESTAATGLYLVAMLAFALASLGFVTLLDQPEGAAVKLLDLILCNQQDVWLFSGTAVVLLICGLMNTSSRQIVRD